MLPIVHSNQISWAYTGFVQGFFKGGEPFYPRIGENIVEVPIDLSWHSKLHFPEPLEEGMILWQLDLGLTDLPLPLQDEGQFMAHARAIEAFVEKLYHVYKERTFGISLYKGPFLLSEWDEIIDYCKLLAAYLPEESALFLFLDGQGLSDPLFLSLMNKERYFPFHLIVAHPMVARLPYSFEVIGWGSATVMGAAYTASPTITTKRLPHAFLLDEDSPIEKVERLSARFIPEALLTEMWEGVEELYVISHKLSALGKRKVAGFVAAGGVVHHL